jgi:hypothetical protein
MNILNHFRHWCRALVMTAFSMQLVTSCKPKSPQNLNPASNSQKTESQRDAEPRRTFKSPQLQKLAETSDPEECTRLVLQLGEQKVVEAVPYLVAKITAIKSPHVYNAMDWNNGYPCSTALAQIGDVAVPQIQNQFTGTASGVEQLILLHTLIRIKGAQVVADWLETLKPNNQTIIPEDRLNELKGWVQSQVRASGASVQKPTK